MKTKSLFLQAILKRSPVKLISKSVTTPTIITTAMILMNQLFRELFGKIIIQFGIDHPRTIEEENMPNSGLNVSRTRSTYAGATNWLLLFNEENLY